MGHRLTDTGRRLIQCGVTVFSDAQINLAVISFISTVRASSEEGPEGRSFIWKQQVQV